MGTGYIGLGTMGLPMAMCVARSAADLTVFDLRPEPCAALEHAGAKPAASPKDVALRNDVVHINVVDEQQVRTVLLADDGVVSGARPGTVVVVHSTIHPTACAELAHALAPNGLGLVDAPFSGGLAAAEAGTLTFMVGGDYDAVAKARPSLDAMSSSIFHVGSVGMGEMAKIANNAVLSVVLQGTKEALALAGRAGIDESKMIEILCASAGESWVTRNWEAIAAMTAGYPGGAKGLGDLIFKDLSIAVSVAHQHEAFVPLTALATQLISQP